MQIISNDLKEFADKGKQAMQETIKKTGGLSNIARKETYK